MTSRGILGIAVCTASINLASAAEWSFEPSITALTRYDDNFRLSTSDEVSTTEFSLKPSADFSRKTERTDITGTANFEFRRYDEDALDTNDSEFEIDIAHFLSELTRVGFNANWIDDTTLDSEFDETGIFFDRVERQRMSYSPSISHQFSQRWSASANALISTAEYDTTDITYNDYDYDSISGQLNWAYSLKTTLFTSLGTSRYETQNGAYKSDTDQLYIGFTHQYSERMTLEAYAGRRETETTRVADGSPDCPANAVPVDFFTFLITGQPCEDITTGLPVAAIIPTITTRNDSSGSVYNIDLTRELERGALSFNIFNRISPSATQGVIDTTQLRLNWNHRFTETVSGDLTLRWSDTQSTDDVTSSVDRTSIQVNPRLNWNISRDLRFSADYRYRKQEREGVLGSATSNAVSFALNYRWPKVAVSR